MDSRNIPGFSRRLKLSSAHPTAGNNKHIKFNENVITDSQLFQEKDVMQTKTISSRQAKNTMKKITAEGSKSTQKLHSYEEKQSIAKGTKLVESKSSTKHPEHKSIKKSMKQSTSSTQKMLTKYSNTLKKNSSIFRSQNVQRKSESSSITSNNQLIQIKNHKESKSSTERSLTNVSDLYAMDKTGMTLSKLNEEQVAAHPLVQQIVKTKIEKTKNEMEKKIHLKYLRYNKLALEAKAHGSRNNGQEKRRKICNQSDMYSFDTAMSPSSESQQSFHGFSSDAICDGKQSKIKKSVEVFDVVPKNINRNHFFKCHQSNVCIVCHRTCNRMVSHLKSMHPNHEVFVSRLSPKMAEIAIRNLNSMRISLKRFSKYAEAICFFCEEKKNFSISFWVNHIRSHTGEYVNRCHNCDKFVCFNQHCGMSAKCTDVIDIKTTDLMAFICRKCNFVQISEKNMHKHLLDEHGFKEIDNQYKRFVLLTAWDNKISQSKSTQTSILGNIFK